MKKAVLLVIGILFSLAVMAQQYDFSAVAPSGQTLYYKIANAGNSVSVTYPNNDNYSPYAGFVEPTDTVVIPDSVFNNGHTYAVSSISDWSFAFCSNIVAVTIPTTVKAIGDCAFGSCLSLSSFVIPDSVTQLGVCAFQDCAIDTVVIPQSVVSIGNFAFKNCVNLVSLTIPTSVINMGFMSFDSCINLTTITIDTNTLHLLSNDTMLGTAYIQLPTASTWDYSFQLVASPKQHCKLYSWSNGGINNPETILLDNDSIVTAIFTYILEPNILMVDVENERNVVYFDNDENAIHHNIYRESVVANEYELIATISSDSASVWIDSSSRPNVRSYRYRVSGIDQFGYESDLSTAHKTMHLSINQGVGGRWNLSWTPYEGADYSTYIIYRGTSASEMEQIDIMPANGNTSYTDEQPPSGEVYYQIGIVMNNSSQLVPTKTESISRSNIATNSSTQGISNVVTDDISIYSERNRIIVEGTTDEVQVFDMVGRKVRNESLTAGVYMVKIGTLPARKVVIR